MGQLTQGGGNPPLSSSFKTAVDAMSSSRLKEASLGIYKKWCAVVGPSYSVAGLHQMERLLLL